MKFNSCKVYSFSRTDRKSEDKEIEYRRKTKSPGPGAYYPSNYTFKNPPGFK